MPDQPKHVTLTIDGKPVTVPEGTTVLQACEKANSPVPFYCYHPGLSIAGNCRICLVEIEKTPKLQISCYTRVAEGMVVNTASEKALKARRDVLEFLLVNHPLDCPVCDQAGECWLQDYYMEHGLYDPKFDENKQKKSKKATPIGPKVVLDMDRCILCSRCVRFTDEITKTGELGIFNRGDHAELDVQPGKQVDNNYSGNIVDICPVGALTDRDFRFKCRVWYLGAQKSVCPGCSMGCNIEIHYNRERLVRPHVAGGDRVMRLKPRYNPDVNTWWMCDTGRYAYGSIDHNRIQQAQLRNGHMNPAGHADALGAVAGALRKLKERNALDRFGVLLSTYMTNESLYVAKKLFESLGVTHVAVRGPKPAEGDNLLLKADRSSNTRGAQALGLKFEADQLIERAAKKELSALYVFDHDLTALYGPDIKQKLVGLELLAYQASNATPTGEFAHVILPASVYAEQDGTFTNFQGRVQRIWQAVDPMGHSKPHWQLLLELGQQLGATMKFSTAQEIFADIAARESAFAGLNYDLIGEQGALLKA